MLDHLRKLLLRDLETCEREVRLYPDDASLWRTLPGLPNSAGNLVLHTCGNLRYFVGVQLGGTAYVRDRDGEFSRSGLTREELVSELETTRSEVSSVLSRLEPGRLEQPFPAQVAGITLPAGLFLAHLAVHLAYHLGQLDYHRRAVTGDPASANAQSVPALAR